MRQGRELSYLLWSEPLILPAHLCPDVFRTKIQPQSKDVMTKVLLPPPASVPTALLALESPAQISRWVSLTRPPKRPSPVSRRHHGCPGGCVGNAPCDPGPLCCSSFTSCPLESPQALAAMWRVHRVAKTLLPLDGAPGGKGGDTVHGGPAGPGRGGRCGDPRPGRGGTQCTGAGPGRGGRSARGRSFGLHCLGLQLGHIQEQAISSERTSQDM